MAGKHCTKRNSRQGPELVLAIESSCDETAAAVLKNGTCLLSNIVASQIDIHRQYGGIVPELASRHHLKDIYRVVEKALSDASLEISSIDAIAVTQGPGLVGSLVVGLSFAKAIALARGIPFTGVNHLHAHLCSAFLQDRRPEFPFIGLVVSGGHTSIYLVRDMLSAKLLGRTRDDAAGEAFDKVAKILGLDYPGGPVISRLAASGDPDAFSYPRAILPDTPLDFSFSGLKTSVLTSVKRMTGDGKLPVPDICASFQEAVVDVLVKKTITAAREHGIHEIVVTGGVAANPRLRQKLTETAENIGYSSYFPDPELCTDNAAMIAKAGYHQLKAGIEAGDDADVYSRIQPGCKTAL
ncbi:MAG TPA: tRNA (adenosine(37)-N6)-threonylcarbamoyltransferase complex transferase subunit TsaD [Thermodesulfobacteriaceae bacterium]|nr:tRNA (adenosine(37)-N6)-threonylcarbamoyltransferase complex transferase subunit TsaD [Thermodesulfobacteriaceae bacterium]